MIEQTQTLHRKVNKKTLLRYQVIEIIAYWEGRVTTVHLCNCFDIGRQQASREINAYLEEHAPGNLEYDPHIAGYTTSKTFNPVFTRGRVDEYLNLLALNERLVTKSNYSALGFREVTSVIPPTRAIDPVIMRALVRAISKGRRLEIEYLSMSSAEPEARIIAPHSLVETPLRWHVRAYCEKSRAYRDFMLSRFVGEPEELGSSTNPIEEDTDWNTPIQLVLQADPRLNSHQMSLIERDYGMCDGELVIPSKLSQINYLIDGFGLSLNHVQTEPGHQPVSIKNREELISTLSKRGLLKHQL
ncbi:helix-turn-helix transcriptional regulator [Aeromonas fluvialis]|uniref:helix-turn-helix transcriptional regulator n=1 Tax=Aeromonas fluvialis TaxID=591962 RepID=UPI00069326E1|nr:WYL domain-containing protein [Aeromonas fluvialis]